MGPAHLGCYEVSRVARGHQQAVVGAQLLSEAEVADPDRFRISRLVDVEDVAGLQVSVHDLRRGKAECKVRLAWARVRPHGQEGKVTHPLRVQVLHSLGDGVQHSAGLSL